MTRTAGKKGKLPARFPSQLGKLTSYLTASLPTPPAGPWGYALTDGYTMALNDTYGDCTIAGKVHLDEVVATILNEPYTYPGDSAVLAGYAQLLGCSVEQLQSDPQKYDTGLDLATVIKAWSGPQGFLGSRIVGAASIDIHDWETLLTALYNFGALYVGIQCPASIDQQFESDGYWHTTSQYEPLEGGHCVVVNGVATVDTSVGVRPDFALVTWGVEFAMTEGFWNEFGDEAWVVIPSAMATAGHDAVQALNLAQMTADLKALQEAT